MDRARTDQCTRVPCGQKSTELKRRYGVARTRRGSKLAHSVTIGSHRDFVTLFFQYFDQSVASELIVFSNEYFHD